MEQGGETNRTLYRTIGIMYQVLHFFNNTRYQGYKNTGEERVQK